jgi:DNA-binding winged helix-turn-helix (wHTH) protein
MKFLFNKHVIFDSDTGSLAVHDEQDDPVQISNPTKRLLLLLLNHQGEVVNREVIFKKVWDDFGMVSSNNNLNHCISKLRRILRILGLEDEIITTVPKIGFMFQEEIQIEALPEPPDVMQDEPIIRDIPASESTASVKTAQTATSSLRTTKVMNWLSMVIAITTLMASAGFWYNNRPLDRKEVFMGKAGTCSVMVSEQLLHNGDAVSFKSGLMRYAQDLNPQCNSDQYLLVIKSRSYKTWSQELSRLYFMRCANLRESKAEVCWSLTEPPHSGP